jgi:hypothetical protein
MNYEMIGSGKELFKRLQAFADNPSEETIDNITQSSRAFFRQQYANKNFGEGFHYCYFARIVGPIDRCPKGCPGQNPSYPVCNNLAYLWEYHPGKAVLFAIQLLAFIKSFISGEVDNEIYPTRGNS